MEGQSVAFSALAGYARGETERWREWMASRPEVLDLSLGAGSAETVRDLVKHIFAVELRYAERLAGEPESDYEQLPDGDVDALWSIHRKAARLLDGWLATARAADLDRTLSFQTRRAGRLDSRAHTIVVHTFIHGIRHWAQIATALRQHGHANLWYHDWLMSPAVQ